MANIKRQDFLEGESAGEKWVLLIDNGSDRHEFAWTDDMDKIAFNRRYLPELERAIQAQLGLAVAGASVAGFTVLHYAGRYVILYQQAYAGNEAHMYFFDCQSDLPSRGMFSERINDAIRLYCEKRRHELTQTTDGVQSSPTLHPPPVPACLTFSSNRPDFGLVAS